jgi:hypothetical protein
MLLLLKPFQAYCWPGIADAGGFLPSNEEDFLCSHGFTIYFLKNNFFIKFDRIKNDLIKSEPFKK